MYGLIAFNFTFSILFACLIMTYIRDRNKPNPWQYEWIVLIWYFRIISITFDINDKKEYSDLQYFVGKFASAQVMLVVQQILITVTFKNIKIKILTAALIPIVANISIVVVFDDSTHVIKFMFLGMLWYYPPLFSFVYF